MTGELPAIDPETIAAVYRHRYGLSANAPVTLTIPGTVLTTMIGVNETVPQLTRRQARRAMLYRLAVFRRAYPGLRAVVAGDILTDPRALQPLRKPSIRTRRKHSHR